MNFQQDCEFYGLQSLFLGSVGWDFTGDVAVEDYSAHRSAEVDFIVLPCGMERKGETKEEREGGRENWEVRTWYS